MLVSVCAVLIICSKIFGFLTKAPLYPRQGLLSTFFLHKINIF